MAGAVLDTPPHPRDSRLIVASVIPIVTAEEAYRVGALFDGARRVAHTALCVLALDDVIDLGRDVEAMALRTGVAMNKVLAASDAGVIPTVSVTGTTPTELHPVETATVAQIGNGDVSVDELMIELRRNPAIVTLVVGCIDAGLVRRNGARAIRKWPERLAWSRRVPATIDIEDVATRRLLLAVHGPTLLFEIAPEIPLALGFRRRPPDADWLKMTGGG